MLTDSEVPPFTSAGSVQPSPLYGLIAPGLAAIEFIHVHQAIHLILYSMPVVWINSSADQADKIPHW